MKKYKFCPKGKDEAVAYVNASSKIDAISYFAKLKNLEAEVFQKIYDVKRA